MGGRGAFERGVERTSHAIAGSLDIVWAIPGAIRLNRALIASAAVLVLAGLAAGVANGGFGVPEAARAVPVGGEVGPGPEASGGAGTPEPSEDTTGPGLSFEPVVPGASGSSPAT
jgi:hypothetical protein